MKKTTKLSDPNGDTYYEGDYSGTSNVETTGAGDFIFP
jgi:hypothetical protein